MFDPVEALPPLREVIEQADLKATKALGQNFLCDLNLTRKIARQAEIRCDDHLIEIGPGPGGLTRGLLLERAQHLTAIEYDERAINALQSLKNAAGDRLILVHDDALRTDCRNYGDNGHRKIVANLPYNIATPLLIGWMKHIYEAGSDAYQSITVMVQKEVADRITAQVGTKAYGRLSIITQWLCDARQCFDVPASAFVPPPKVTSTIIQLKHKNRSDNVPFEVMEQLTEAAFGQRRKMIRQSMKPYLSAIHAAGIDETLRAENLNIQDFLNIAKELS